MTTNILQYDPILIKTAQNIPPVVPDNMPKPIIHPHPGITDIHTAAIPGAVRLFALFLFVILLIPGITNAQFYDTVHRPKLDWYEINTKHFRIVYHDGFEDIAQRSAVILERRYEEIRSLTGGELKNYPVVINGYNDLSNGYITTLHFRMEIEAPPIAGKILNPVGSDRLDGLLSHELTHALQFSVSGTFGFTKLISLFSPDLARSNHGLSPPGFHEGLATHVESELNPTVSGRGNYAPFSNQFYQNINGDSPWNLSRLLTPSTIYRPADRYYNGGYHFVDWLIKTQKPDLVRTSLRSFANFPFLGYAPHLWYHTGKSPKKLYREFIQDKKQISDSLVAAHSASPNYRILENDHQKGGFAFTPVWLNAHEIIYYASFYNQKPGFYRVDVRDNSHTLVYETRIEESYQFSLSPDKSRLIYARYHPHLYYDNHYTTDIYELDLKTYKSQRITKDSRARAPVYLDSNTIAALQSDLDKHIPVLFYTHDTVGASTEKSAQQSGSSDLKEVHTPGDPSSPAQQDEPSISQNDFNADTQLTKDRPNFIQIAVNPRIYATDTTDNTRIYPVSAAIITVKAQTGIYFSTDLSQIMPDASQGPDIYFENSSIYDLAWSPDGKKLLFSMDKNNVMQLFEYDTEQRTIHQLTNGPWNSMEASYSDDGTVIAFISLASNRRKIAILDYDRFERIPGTVKTGEIRPQLSNFSAIPEQPGDYAQKPYKTGAAWLIPRTVIPISNQVNNKGSRSAGLSLHSSDILRKNAYALDVEYAKNNVYYDLNYRFTGFFPAIQTTVKRSPYNPGNLLQGGGLEFFGEEQEYGLSAPMTFNLDHRNSSNSLIINPEILYRTARIHLKDNRFPENNQVTGWSGSNRFRLFTAYNYRIKQNVRSIGPDHGIVFFAQADHDIKMYSTELSPFRGLQSGFYLFTSPAARLNHTLRLGFKSVIQNRFGYNTLNMIHEAFDTDGFSITDRNFNTVSIRYNIPLGYPDTGGILIPAFIENYYLTMFSESIFSSQFSHRDSVMGIGLRGRFRLFYNVVFDLGVGIAINPTRKGSETIVLNF